MAPPRERIRRVVRRMRHSPIGVLRRAGVVEPRAAAAVLASLPRLAGRGGSLGWISHVNAQALGAKPAIIDRRGTLTWRDLDSRANRLARVLERRGVRPGSSVATLLRNGRELAEVVLATQKLGAVTAPLNTWARPDELRAVLETSSPRLLVVDVRHAEPLDATGTDAPRVLVGADAPSDEGYEDVLAAEPDRPLPAVTLRRARPRVMIHTSGTTGRPKAASRGAGRTDARAFLDVLSVVPLHRRDVILCPAPLFHSFGMLTLTLWTMLGATIVLPDAFDPEDALELIERHRVTVAAFVPVMLHRIAALPEERRTHDTSTVRAVIASGSAIPPALREQVTRIFGPTLYDMYGSTETGLVSIATPEDIEARADAVGRVLPGVDVAVFDADGRRLPHGEVGGLFVRSEGAFEGYAGAEAPREIDGYMAIGDVGRVDRDGYVFVEGRADDMVIVGAENVYPVEVEEVILRVDGVREAAVVGVDDPEYGKVLAAFVAGDVTPEAIEAACRRSLASYKVPRRIDLVPELPRTATGKVLVRQLRAQKE